jgi:hypothetical protein
MIENILKELGSQSGIGSSTEEWIASLYVQEISGEHALLESGKESSSSTPWTSTVGHPVTIDGAKYKWTGSIKNGRFKGTFESPRYDGTFDLKKK